MAREPRRDAPGMVHHLMNRGLAHRTLFETGADKDRFLSLLAGAAEDGRIEVRSFVVMDTHFHVEARSVDGEISSTLQWIESQYARGFNLRMSRDGPLHKSRFRSKPVESETYAMALVSYIDRNPAEAGIVEHGAAYPYSSAFYYMHREGPPWLERTWVEERVCRYSGIERYDPACYLRVFRRGVSDGRLRWIENRMRCASDGDDPLDRLVGAPPAHVRQWLRENAVLADGRCATPPLVDEASVLGAIAARRAASPESLIRLRRRSRPLWPILCVGLLHSAVRMNYVQISTCLSAPYRTVAELRGQHDWLLRESDAYAERAADVLADALSRCHGDFHASGASPSGRKTLAHRE